MTKDADFDPRQVAIDLVRIGQSLRDQHDELSARTPVTEALPPDPPAEPAGPRDERDD